MTVDGLRCPTGVKATSASLCTFPDKTSEDIDSGHLDCAKPARRKSACTVNVVEVPVNAPGSRRGSACQVNMNSSGEVVGGSNACIQPSRRIEADSAKDDVLAAAAFAPHSPNRAAYHQNSDTDVLLKQAAVLQFVTNAVRESLDTEQILVATCKAVQAVYGSDIAMVRRIDDGKMSDYASVFMRPGYTGDYPHGPCPMMPRLAFAEFMRMDGVMYCCCLQDFINMAGEVGFNSDELAAANEYMRTTNLQSTLAVKSTYGTPPKVNGCLVLDNYTTGSRKYNQSDISLFKAIADQVGIALEHARLMESEQEARKALSKQYNLLVEQNKALEEARIQADAANRAKSDFLAMITHELRTPAACVISLAQEMKNVPKPDQQNELLDLILSSGNGLLTLIEDILEAANLDEKSDAKSPQLAVFNLRECMRNLVDLHRGSAAVKDIELLLNIDPACAEFVISDVRRMRQICTNVIANAIKFSMRGKVAVDVTWAISSMSKSFTSPQVNLIAAAGEVSGDVFDLSVAVKDTGIGIPPSQMGLLFQKFTQADSSASRKFAGTGLGLFIAYKLAHMLGGNISANSVEGVGSTFTISVPVRVTMRTPLPKIIPEFGARVVEGVKKEANEEKNKQSFPNILLAEDHPVNAKIVTLMLTKIGYQHIDWVENGALALKALQVKTYSVVLLDLLMPEMDGLTACRHIVAHYPREQRPLIVALTANTSVRDQEQCYAAGFDVYLSKPVKRETLASTLSRARACTL
mmetsp:Transcript_12926/g.21792  ORF Transcript_12926/g.21792 Transcript_12926/m.21792 type:complete len:751 (+) Transcript_12926:122-2374(+)